MNTQKVSRFCHYWQKKTKCRSLCWRSLTFYAKRGDANEAETFLVEAGSGNGKSDRLWRTVNASIYAERAQLSYQSSKFDEARSFVFTALNSYPANKKLLGMLISIELGAGALTRQKRCLKS